MKYNLVVSLLSLFAACQCSADTVRIEFQGQVTGVNFAADPFILVGTPFSGFLDVDLDSPAAFSEPDRAQFQQSPVTDARLSVAGISYELSSSSTSQLDLNDDSFDVLQFNDSDRINVMASSFDGLFLPSGFALHSLGLTLVDSTGVELNNVDLRDALDFSGLEDFTASVTGIGTQFRGPTGVRNFSGTLSSLTVSLSPVPEPTSIALFCFMATGLLTRRQK